MGNIAHTKTTIKKSQKKKYFRLISRSKEPVLLVDTQNKYVKGNQAAVQLFEGKNFEELQSAGVEKLTPKVQPHLKMDSQSAVVAFINNAVEKNQGYQDFDFQHITVTGKPFWVHIWITPINLGGELIVQKVLRKIDAPKNEKSFEFSSLPDLKIISPDLQISKTTQFPISSNSEVNVSKNFTDLVAPQLSSDSSQAQTPTTPTQSQSKIQNLTSGNESDPDEFMQNYGHENEKRHHRSLSTTLSSHKPTEELEKLLQEIKKQIQSLSNKEIEDPILKNLDEISECFKGSIQKRDEQIEKFFDKLSTERKEHDKKYEKLEAHFQRRLSGLETEKQDKKTFLEEGFRMKKAFNLISKYSQEQDKIIDKLGRAILSLKENNIIKIDNFDEFSSFSDDEF
ncbi:hypothetical protein M0811_05867 [Anaeramoeba ignava]|uniref:Uncharacterized protein n=1 Tax=Anaeramoeba ignava TaxID=1746090 RepID=A0A9Q0LU70_ANAIG|nr:hypothetical protein M0811_05867 [Anaeramoeba ignava]|eukprot:Anaeramoba_ignava/a619887_44.p1 GENE.a619887_44~~a619887_44.p1  ORF type:complete len:397 (+),score=156.99 a619887_44:81-1271(+)